jgi:hypothetical protein
MQLNFGRAPAASAPLTARGGVESHQAHSSSLGLEVGAVFWLYEIKTSAHGAVEESFQTGLQTNVISFITTRSDKLQLLLAA